MSNFKKITSKSNLIVKNFLNPNKDEFVLCSINLINEAINSNHKIKQILVLDSKQLILDNKIIDYCKQNIFLITKEICEKLSKNKNFSYVFAIVQKPQNNKIEKTDAKNIVLLDNVQNPENIGLISRTMLGLGYDLIFLYNCCCKYNIKAISSSAGICLNKNIIEINDLELLKNNFKKHIVISTTLNEKSENVLDIYTDLKNKNKILVFGNEGKGISEKILKISNKFIKLKMYNNVNSFNISISCALIGFLLIK